jgi:uncharacterized membrane protein YphA (DoxX/SURF4 family)
MNNKSWKDLLITILRVSIGWHFLYEGASKILAGDWTSEGFLLGSNSFLSGFYHLLASSPGMVQAVDILNMYGLFLIGLGLFFGILVRYAAVGGVVLLAMYYFVYPPFGKSLIMHSEGTLFIVNKIFIEAVILSLFVFLKNRGWGIERLREYMQKKTKNGNTDPVSSETNNGRRELIKNLSTIPLLGVLGLGAFQSRKKYDIDTSSGATIQIRQAALSELKGELPKGSIGNHEISRLVLGGNLIGGWAHARDLRYASELFKAYNTTEKIFETLMLAEEAGINTMNIGFPSNPVLKKYKDITGSKIQVISQVAPDLENNDYFKNINTAIEHGVDIIQIQGNWTDVCVRDGKIDVIAKMMDYIRDQGFTAGLGAHSVDAHIACEQAGIIPDYYMKTMHHDNYWSAHPKENRELFEVMNGRNPEHHRYHDNLWCSYPERTAEFIGRQKIPVMGFKVLAAGAIKAKEGFEWAFRNGADFICVGMFDFQVVKDVNLVIDILSNLEGRKRDWF